MKVLVLSLLRAGDLIMQRPLFAAIKEQAKDCELHVLINDEVSWIAPVLKEIDHVHIFPRAMLQKMLGENSYNIFKAGLELSSFLEKLNFHQFDQLMNFTHNRLSAYLAEEIQSPLKNGLHTTGLKFNGIENQWMKLFNDRFSGTQDFPFHYTEILARSFNLQVKAPSAPEKSKVNRIFLQILTSDSKKNWGIANYRNLLNEMYSHYPEMTFKVLVSEREVDHLKNHFEAEEICTWNLSTLEQEFKSSDLLVSGDTVTMHLAAQKSAQIIEIALGSSDPWKTGPYGSGHWILTSKADCYPCTHSSPCRKLSHLCSQPITPKIVSKLIAKVIENTQDFENLSQPKDSIQVLRSQVMDYGYELVKVNGSKDIRVLNKILWQKIIEQDLEIQNLNFQDFGLTNESIDDLQSELKETLFILQMDFENLVQKLGAHSLTSSCVQEVRRKMAQLSSSAGNREWIWMFLDLGQLSFTTPLHFLSAFQDRLEILKAAIFYRSQITSQNHHQMDYSI